MQRCMLWIRALLFTTRNIWCKLLVYLSASIPVFFVIKHGGQPMHNEYFLTSRGVARSAEIDDAVFRKHGYNMKELQLIPVLQRMCEETCDTIFHRSLDSSLTGSPEKPPLVPPNAIDFTLNDYSLFDLIYFNSVTNTAGTKWGNEYLRQLISSAVNNPVVFASQSYSEGVSLNSAIQRYPVSNRRGAIIGSETPWVEALCIANGARRLVTVDYRELTIEHPDISFIHAVDFAKRREAFYNAFDFVVSFSSVEHSGLGRYGDPLNPIGDILELRKILCILKKSGYLFLTIPIGRDHVFFNAHRVYGRLRLPILLYGFDFLGAFDATGNPIKLTRHALQRSSKDAMDIVQYTLVLQKT